MPENATVLIPDIYLCICVCHLQKSRFLLNTRNTLTRRDSTVWLADDGECQMSVPTGKFTAQS